MNDRVVLSVFAEIRVFLGWFLMKEGITNPRETDPISLIPNINLKFQISNFKFENSDPLCKSLPSSVSFGGNKMPAPAGVPKTKKRPRRC